MKAGKFVATPISALICVLFTSQLALAAEDWLIHYPKALELSKETGKPVLADFTGSDWCGWCIALKREVFVTDEFKNWAKDNVILLELDYPARKRQSAAIAKQNAELQNKYGIEGYPTILFLDSDGKVLGRSGYMEGGPGPWIKHASQIVKKATPKKEEKQEEAVASTDGAADETKNEESSAVTGGGRVEGFAAAMDKARSMSTPLLVVVYDSKAATKKRVEAVLSDSNFQAAANRITWVEFDTAGQDASDAAALKELRQKHKIRETPVQYLLLNVADDKLITALYAAADASAVVKQIEKAQ